jgi:ESCRT-II complex subunit VPS22
MWAELLGFGDFYFELGVQVVEQCMATRSVNGGLMEVGELTQRVMKRRGGQAEPVTADDVVRAIKKLQVCRKAGEARQGRPE